MKTIDIAILRGGPGPGYEVSLKSAENVIANLPPQYRVRDIAIDKAGAWYVRGVQKDPHDALEGVQVAFSTLNGLYGEDGKLQAILKTLGIPFVGSKSLASAMAMNKGMAKNVFVQNGLKTPHFRIFSSEQPVAEIASEIFRTMPLPVIVKPISGSLSMNITVARDQASIAVALTDVFAKYEGAIVEEYIQGREATGGVVEGFRGKEMYHLLPVEISHQGIMREVCPGNFTPEEKMVMEDMSERAHKALGLSHYSHSDFIVHPKRGVYILEVNTLPSLASDSLIPKALAAAGATFPEFLDHVISLAREAK